VRAAGGPVALRIFLGGKIAMLKHAWYIHEGFCGGREERARFSPKMAMFLSREGINERYLCAMSNTEYRGPDARGLSATIPNRTYHLIEKRNLLRYGIDA
jgi:hypothetical protein